MFQFYNKAMAFVTGAPVINSLSPLLSAEVGFNYANQLFASSGTQPYTWAQIAGTLPAGLNLSASGVLSGTPTTAQVYLFTLQVTDSLGLQSNPVQFTQTVVAQLAISTGSTLPAATQGSIYNTTIAAINGVAPYVWSIQSQTGTNGWVINSSTGVLSGIPANAETDSITVQVTDALNYSVQKVFSLTVQSNYIAPTITTQSPLLSATQNQAYSFQMQAVNGTLPYTWSIMSETGSNVWVISPGGLITGTPGTAETDTLNIKLVDAHPTTVGPQAFTLVVNTAVVPAAQKKWIPGIYMMDQRFDQLGPFTDSINAFAASWTGNGGKTVGYAFWAKWGASVAQGGIEDASPGVYNWALIDNTIAALHAAAPGAPYVIMVNWHDFLQDTPANIQSGAFNPIDNSSVPSYILNDSATYGAGPNGNRAGWVPAAFNPGTGKFLFSYANLSSANVVTRLKNMFAALAARYDSDPLLALVGTGTPSDVGTNTTNIPPNTNFTSLNNGYLSLTSIASSFATTPFFLAPGFGSNISGQDNFSQNTLIHQMSTAGVAQSCTDVFSQVNAVSSGAFTFAQNFFIGNTFDGSNPSFQPPLKGIMASTPTVQGSDYSRGVIGPPGPNTSGQAQNIINNAVQLLQASHILMAIQDGNGATNASFWSGTILPVINGTALPTLNQEIVTDYMYGPTIVSLFPVTTTTVTVNLPNITGQGPNLKIQVFRNGVATGAPQAVNTSFVDTGLTPSTQYSYTLAMSNDNAPNGAGAPKGPAVLTFTADAPGTVSITWTAVAGANSYNVYQGTGNTTDGPTSPATKILSGLTNTQVLITGLVSGTLLYFEVSSVTGGVESALSSPIYVTVP